MAFIAAASLPLLIYSACATNSLTAKGGPCVQAIDCQLGLVCIGAGDGGVGICTDDLDGTVNVPPTPDGAANDVAQQETSTDAPPPQDTGTQDTGTQDTGVQDTGTQDTGAQDAGNG